MTDADEVTLERIGKDDEGETEACSKRDIKVAMVIDWTVGTSK